MYVPGRQHDRPNRSEKLLSVPGLEDIQCEASNIEFEHVCEPCTDDGHRFEAYGFCSDCNHYLCETCYTAHRRPIPMRNHKLLDKNEMPRVRSKHISVSNEVIEEKCDVHVGKLVEFYCGNHDTIGCSVCMTLKHKSCDGVQFVPDMNIDKSEVEEVMKQLSVFSGNAKATQICAKERVSITKFSFDNAQQDAKQFSKQAKGFIDRLEKTMESTIQKERENEVRKVESVIESLEETLRETESLSEELSGYISFKKEANSFIAMKKAEKFMEYFSLEGDLDVSSEGSNAKYVFVPSEKLVSLQGEIECLGIVERVSKQIRVEPSSVKKVEVSCFGQFTVNSKDDTSDCIIVGISDIFEPMRTVVADAGNNKIKVIKVYSNTITTSMKLSAKPHAMAKFGHNKVCITIPEEKKVLLITISKLFRKDTIKVAKTLVCGFKCYGLATKGENIIVTCEYEGGSFAINSMNTEGQILNQFKCSADEPMYIAVQNNDFYTLDTKRSLLQCLSILDGSMKNERKIENVIHFTTTDEYVVAVTGLPQELRVFSHDFQDIDAEWSVGDDKFTPVHVEHDCFDISIGCNDGRVRSCAMSLLDE